MKGKYRTGIAAAIAMLVLILDAKTAASGALEGIKSCICTVIPSLLPFFVLSILLTGTITGTGSKLLKPLGRLLRVSSGSESLFLLGLLGGYPTGAQAVAQAYRTGQLTKTEASRMLGFCSNAGPSFLFGIAAAAFEKSWMSWVIWLIHILSAMLTAVILPGGSDRSCRISGKSVTLTEALERSIRIMARVCGWIVLFRILLSFCNRWFLWLLPAEGVVAFTGILELANGCLMLPQIPSEGLRMILCTAFLSFGGLCVMLQTASVTGVLGMGMYVKGKLLQGWISLILATIAQHLLVPESMRWPIPAPLWGIFAGILIILVFWVRKTEIKSSFLQEVGV